MKTFINEWVVPSIIAVVIVLFLNRFIFILVTVPTGSMETTIMPGDRLYVNKLFDVKDAKRGDILVFQSDELDARLVKRLIGLPGETVEKYNIPYQYRKISSGGNDSGKIHQAKGGCVTTTISVPCRYIHSPISVMSKNDYDNTFKLVKSVITEMEKGDF